MVITALLPMPEHAAPTVAGAAGLYGSTLPLAIAAFARSSAERAAALLRAAQAMERVERAWQVELSVLEVETELMARRTAGFAARRDELVRFARALPETVPARRSLEDAAQRLGDVVAELAAGTGRLRSRTGRERAALEACADALAHGAGCARLAAETVEQAQLAVRIGDEIVSAGRRVVDALKRF